MSVSTVGHSPVPAAPPARPAPPARGADGDTAAQEAAESIATKSAEVQNGGIAPKNAVNKHA